MDRIFFKRICSLLLCLVMTFSLLPAALAADPGAELAGGADAEAVPESAAIPEDDDPSAEEAPCAKASGTAYVINGVTVHYDDFTSTPHECWTYANNMYYKIWRQYFTNRFDDVNNSLRKLSDSELTLTEEHLKAYVSAAALGSILRICNSEYLHGDDGWGHSQIIVAKDANGFTVLEGGLTDSPYCQEAHYTWSQYVRTGWLGGKYAYIKYIKWPGAPEYSGSLPTPTPTPTITDIQNGVSVVTLSWSAVPGAAKYAVYRKAGGESSYVLYNITDALSFADSSTVNGTFYYYRIWALDSSGNTLGEWSNARGITCIRNVTPTITSITNTDDGIKLTWGAVSGVAKYAVYRKAEGDSKYTRYTITTATTYTDRNAVNGTFYYFRIWSMDSSGATLGDWSDARGITRPAPQVEKPLITSITITSDGVKLAWNAVSGAAKYAVYRKPSGASSFSRYTVTTATTYTDRNAASCPYEYRIWCLSSSGGTLGEWSDARSISFPTTQVEKPDISSIANTSDGVKLTWVAVSGAAKYAVYRKANSDSKYTRYTITTATTYTDKNAVNGTFYYYRIWCLNASGATLGDWSDARGITRQAQAVQVASPTISSIANTSNGVKLTWNAVSGAAKYAVYRKAEGASKYTRYTITTATSYTDRNAVNGTFYYYRIWCMNSSGTTLGDWSNARGITCNRSSKIY